MLIWDTVHLCVNTWLHRQGDEKMWWKTESRAGDEQRWNQEPYGWGEKRGATDPSTESGGSDGRHCHAASGKHLTDVWSFLTANRKGEKNPVKIAVAQRRAHPPARGLVGKHVTIDPHGSIRFSYNQLVQCNRRLHPGLYYTGNDRQQHPLSPFSLTPKHCRRRQLWLTLASIRNRKRWCSIKCPDDVTTYKRKLNLEEEGWNLHGCDVFNRSAWE